MPITQRQLIHLEALIKKFDPYFKYTTLLELVGRDIQFLYELTEEEATLAINHLKKEHGLG